MISKPSFFSAASSALSAITTFCLLFAAFSLSSSVRILSAGSVIHSGTEDFLQQRIVAIESKNRGLQSDNMVLQARVDDIVRRLHVLEAAGD